MRRQNLFVWLSLSLLLVACDFRPSSKGEAFFKRGAVLENEKKYAEAELAYLQCLTRAPKHTEANYRLAFLYECYLNQPALARYYYQNFLDNGAYGKREETTKEKIALLDEQELNLLLKRPVGAKIMTNLQNNEQYLQNKNKQIIEENQKLTNFIERLKVQNKLLREEIIKRSTPTTKVETKPFTPPSPKIIKTSEISPDSLQKNNIYIVQERDTLSKISQKYYKTTTKWRLILEYNSEALHGSEKNLKPGMRLVIPALKQSSISEEEIPAG